MTEKYARFFKNVPTPASLLHKHLLLGHELMCVWGLVWGTRGHRADYKRVREDRPASADKGGWKY